MAWQIIKQPDGLFGVFSSNVDDWIATDCTAGEVEELFADCTAGEVEELFAEDMGRETARRLADVREKVALVAAGNARKVYYQFAMSYEEAEERRAEVHAHEDGFEPAPTTAGKGEADA